MTLKNIWLVPAALFVPATVNAVQYLTAEQAQKVIFPESKNFEPLKLNFSEEEISKIKDVSGLPMDEARLEAWRVTGEKGISGYFFISDVIGKHEYITLALGLALDGSVTGVEIMDYRETQGDQVRDNVWRSQFNGKQISDHLIVGEDVKNISGATYSCKHVTQAIKRILSIYQLKFK